MLVAEKFIYLLVEKYGNILLVLKLVLGMMMIMIMKPVMQID